MADKQRTAATLLGGLVGLAVAVGAIVWFGADAVEEAPALRLRPLTPPTVVAPPAFPGDPTDPGALPFAVPPARPLPANGVPAGHDLAWGDTRLPDLFWAQVPEGVRLLEDAAARVCLVEFPGIDRAQAPEFEGGGLTERQAAGDAVIVTTIDPDRRGMERRLEGQVAGRPIVATSRARWDAAGPTESTVTLEGDGRVLRFRQTLVGAAVVASFVLGEEELGAIVSQVEGARPDLPASPFCVPIEAAAPEVPNP